MVNHPWKLTGPWYRGESIGGVPGGRNSAPIFQKYAASDFANRIVKESQESLKFVSEDFTSRLTTDPDQVVTLPIRKQSQERLKLFLDLHSRFYIVVCSLHCDVAGFPRVNRERVCEAGFVVRRRALKLSDEARKPLAVIMKERAVLRELILKAIKSNSKTSKNSAGKSSGIGELLDKQSQEFVKLYKSAKLPQLQQLYTEKSKVMESLIEEYKVERELQGWKPTDLKGVGNWQKVDESPQTLDEEIYPLYPIIDDPNDRDHTARGQTLWFGLVPTSSGDTTAEGNVKFDDNSVYHTQCVVRRHKPHCPKKNNESDCCGELVWSKPSETYQLASAYDLDGASHRSINIAMPDLKALKKQADLGPAGRGVNAKVISPPDSAPVFASKNMDLPQLGSEPTRPNEQFCFYFSFLFFLVAMFLFRLILPIFMFLFQLWFLLKLKLCIPPSIGLEVDIDVSLDVELELEFELAVDLEVKGDIEAGFGTDSFSIEFKGTTYSKANNNKQAFTDLLAEKIAKGSGVSDSTDVTEEPPLKDNIEEGIKGLGLNDLAATFINMKTQFGDATHPELAGELPTPEKGLHYFEKVLAS
ncbi:MAG: hypothetical protein GY784_11250 [Gammaproteobacteria bacterium]|nr:hypothetical protein [Gammaproteobacteria bacterium]